MTRVHERISAEKCLLDEGGPDINSPDYQTDWAHWAQTFNALQTTGAFHYGMEYRARRTGQRI